MKNWDENDFQGVTFGKNVTLYAEKVHLGHNVCIGDNVTIKAKSISIGVNSIIEKDTQANGLKLNMESFSMGDNSFLGFENQILCPSFSMGDYSQLHNNCLCSGYKSLSMGHNCWIGQNTILNCTDELMIGNNVRVGTQSQLWTHVASGELLEGCTLFGNSPLILEDDVWIVGGAVLSPGLRLKKRTIIMTGAVLTKSTESMRTYAGVPAVDVTPKLSFWRKVSLDEKLKMIKTFVEDFYSEYSCYKNRVLIEPNYSDLIAQKEFSVAIYKKYDWLNSKVPEKVSIFDLTTKKYTKKLSDIEIDFIKFNVGHRARFIPYD